jgi:mRNA-degrading endonuclease RelE of RelBE toxin-antitoxin system
LPYQIQLSRRALEHLRSLAAGQRSRVVAHVREQLSHEPTVETRNRKRMKPNLLASWELRLGELRVYYDVEESPEPQVSIIAIGRKVRERLFIGSEEITL